jgi:acyl dehydratase
MTDTSNLSGDLESRIGMALDPIVLEVEKGAIRRFAQAVEDPNPLYADEAYASQTRHGGVVAPPGFFGWPVTQTAGIETILGTEAAKIVGTSQLDIVNAGYEAEFLLPVRPGDVLTAFPKLANAYHKTGRTGRMLFVVFEVTYRSQTDEVVALMRHTMVFR